MRRKASRVFEGPVGSGDDMTPTHMPWYIIMAPCLRSPSIWKHCCCVLLQGCTCCNLSGCQDVLAILVAKGASTHQAPVFLLGVSSVTFSLKQPAGNARHPW